ncbi:MAG: fibronectin type III domain-containing protein [Verrucomicrobia bacterium]|nr:fibronectin type III domain-containing protein [Verrucomicrobiota bacterium]
MGTVAAQLTWTDVSGSATGYEIRLVDGTLLASIPSGVFSYTVRGLQPGAQYTFIVRGVNSTGASPDSAPATITTTDKTVWEHLLNFGDSPYSVDTSGRTWQSFRLRSVAGSDSQKLEHRNVLLLDSTGDDSLGLIFEATSDGTANMGFQSAAVVVESFFAGNPFAWFNPAQGPQRETPSMNDINRSWTYAFSGFDPNDAVTFELVIRRPDQGRNITLVANAGRSDAQILLNNADSAITRFITHSVTGSDSYTLTLTSNTANWVGTINAMAVRVVRTLEDPQPVDPFAVWAASNGLPADRFAEQDGIPHLLRYALGGTRDSVVSALLPTLTLSPADTGVMMYFSFDRINDASLRYSVWFSEDLLDWGESPVWEGFGSPSAAGKTEISIHSLSGSGFLKLHVSE